MRRMVFSLVVALLLCLAGLPGHGPLALAPAGAQSAPPASQIADQLDSSGRFIQFDATAADDQAIAAANSRGVAFVWLDVDDDAEQLAEDVADELFARPARYSTVLVLTQAGVGAQSDAVGSGEITDAIDASFTSFRNGAVADGLDEFVASLAGQQTPRTSVAPSGSGSTSGSGGGGGSILLPVLGIAVLGGGGLLLLRSLSRKRKARRLAAADLEADRAEIKEQLRDNADRVLQLGDRVIASKDDGLITSYEQASAAYQEVSLAVDGATTAEQVDALDDKIDHAEWQLRSIEARLDGRPAPPPPSDDDATPAGSPGAPGSPPPPGGPTPPAPSSSRSGDDGPALGPDDSIFGGRGGGFPSGPSMPTPSRRQGGGGLGGLGGGRGGGLGSILGSIVLGGLARGGGGLGGLPTSRRSQRRRTSSGSGGLGGSLGGGLGGGVLRPGGSGGSSRSGGSGGRSFGRRSGGGSGGRRF